MLCFIPRDIDGGFLENTQFLGQSSKAKRDIIDLLVVQRCRDWAVLLFVYRPELPAIPVEIVIIATDKAAK